MNSLFFKFFNLVQLKIKYITKRNLINNLKYPFKIQEKILLEIIKSNKNSKFGVDNKFNLINNIELFRKNIKINEYKDFYKYLELEKKGISNSIISNKIEFFAITSGTTSKPKFIPHTKDYINNRQFAWKIWINSVFEEKPETFSKSSKILSFNSKPFDGITKGGIKFGSISGKLHDIQPQLIKSIYAIPDEIFLIDDFKLRYYLILIFSIREDVRLIVTPNPSTLIIFARKIEKYYYELITDLRDNTIKILEEDKNEYLISKDLKSKILKKFTKLKSLNYKTYFKLKSIKTKYGKIYPKYLFKNLQVIGCWKAGSVSIYTKKLPKYYGKNILIKEIGYIASEGRFTIPINNENSKKDNNKKNNNKNNNDSFVLDINSNFFEFVELNNSNYNMDWFKKNNEVKTKLFNELNLGKKYFIIITNENGLYRYFINDIIEVTGFYKKIPRIKFIQKGKYFSSITGEKISEWEIIEALKLVHSKEKFNDITFFVYPNINDKIPYYEYYIEFNTKLEKSKIKIIEELLDINLKNLNIEYKEKRDSERLEKIRIKILKRNSILQLKKGFTNSKNDIQVKVPKLIVLEKDIQIIKKLNLI